MAKTTKKKVLPSFAGHLLDFTCHLRGDSMFDRHIAEVGGDGRPGVDTSLWVAAPSKRDVLLFLWQSDMLRLVEQVADDFEDLGAVTERDFARLHGEATHIIVDQHGCLVSFCRRKFPKAKTIDDVRNICEARIVSADRVLTNLRAADLWF